MSTHIPHDPDEGKLSVEALMPNYLLTELFGEDVDLHDLLKVPQERNIYELGHDGLPVLRSTQAAGGSFRPSTAASQAPSNRGRPMLRDLGWMKQVSGKKPGSQQPAGTSIEAIPSVDEGSSKPTNARPGWWNPSEDDSQHLIGELGGWDSDDDSDYVDEQATGIPGDRVEGDRGKGVDENSTLPNQAESFPDTDAPELGKNDDQVGDDQDTVRTADDYRTETGSLSPNTHRKKKARAKQTMTNKGKAPRGNGKQAASTSSAQEGSSKYSMDYKALTEAMDDLMTGPNDDTAGHLASKADARDPEGSIDTATWRLADEADTVPAVKVDPPRTVDTVKSADDNDVKPTVNEFRTGQHEQTRLTDRKVKGKKSSKAREPKRGDILLKELERSVNFYKAEWNTASKNKSSRLDFGKVSIKGAHNLLDDPKVFAYYNDRDLRVRRQLGTLDLNDTIDDETERSEKANELALKFSLPVMTAYVQAQIQSCKESGTDCPDWTFKRGREYFQSLDQDQSLSGLEKQAEYTKWLVESLTEEDVRLQREILNAEAMPTSAYGQGSWALKELTLWVVQQRLLSSIGTKKTL